MDRLTEKKIILVVRRSRLDELILRYNSIEQAKFCVTQTGADFEEYLLEDKTYKNAIQFTEHHLNRLGRVQVLYREFLPNFIFGRDDTIIALGQDGLVANTLKYLDKQLVLGVNPDPDRHDGVLLPFDVKNVIDALIDVFANKHHTQRVTMAQVRLSDGQKLFAVNDFFIGARTHISARYTICVGGHKEYQSSSGVIISTGLGSTGWLRSIVAGTAGVIKATEGRDVDFESFSNVPPDARHLYYSVREPFPSNVTGTSLVFGKIQEQETLSLTSGMSENGVIFSDGIENDFLTFNSGTVANISVADNYGNLVR